MRCVSVVLVVLAFVLCINAHAVLISPTPFNKNPTTAGPCGVSTITTAMQSTAEATWKAGDPVTIVWDLVAADGGGSVTGNFDPLGGTSFTVPAWTPGSFMTSGSGIIYNHTFIVPADLDCSKSPTGLCSMRVNSGSWNSCTMVKICGPSSNCVAPPAPPATCTAISKKLAFCSNVTSASLAAGFSPSDIDSELSSVFYSNLNKSTVFSTPTNPDCQPLYKQFLCASDLPSCDVKTGKTTADAACKQICQKAMQACGLTELHANLYDCNTLPGCSSAVMGSKGGMSPGGKAALSIFIIALVATVCIFGFIYYKKGQLFGYTYDKDLHKIVKAQSNPHNYTAYVDNEYKM